jgi:hypothetical protein
MARSDMSLAVVGGLYPNKDGSNRLSKWRFPCPESRCGYSANLATRSTLMRSPCSAVAMSSSAICRQSAAAGSARDLCRGRTSGPCFNLQAAVSPSSGSASTAQIRLFPPLDPRPPSQSSRMMASIPMTFRTTIYSRDRARVSSAVSRPNRRDHRRLWIPTPGKEIRPKSGKVIRSVCAASGAPVMISSKRGSSNA